MAKGYYKCECGKEFDNSQRFNGHKRHCSIHLSLTGKNILMAELDKSNKEKVKKTWQKKKLNKLEELSNKISSWLAEEHTCEKCGKIIDKKFGSGRFCSRTCACSRKHSIDVRKKISQTAKSHNKNRINKRHISVKNNYDINPKKCPICHSIIPYERRNRKTCGDKTCLHNYRSLSCKLAHKEGRNKGWIKRNTLSYPEKVWSDILLKNNITYIPQYKVINHKSKKYYFLDFLINNHIDLEIDGGQHKMPEAIKRDSERDAFVKDIGYKVYRIEWEGLKDKLKLEIQIKKLLEFIRKE